VKERFQISANEEDVGKGAEEIVRAAAAADILRPLHALGCIVVSNVMAGVSQ
jgi:hypothetical protein